MTSITTIYAAGPCVRLAGLRAAALTEAGSPAAEGPGADDVDAFLAFADRRRRVRVPSGRDLLLVAQALRAGGRIEEARRELDAALALAPDDFANQGAALLWGGAGARRQAAARVVARPESADDEPALLGLAVAALVEAGARAVHRWRRTPRGVAGFVAWSGTDPLALAFEEGGTTQTFWLDPDARHPLARSGVSAAEVEIETERGEALVLRPLAQGVAPLRLPARLPAPAQVGEALAPVALTIVVPVYDDFPATHACLEALAAAPPAISHRVVVVDDASPNAEIRAYLDKSAASGRFTLLRNVENRGYAGAVNRALALRAVGDALLLNADALLPPGAVDRLAALSRSAPALGALTPFSNNGELTSYPVRHEANPLPTPAKIAALDALARGVNGDALVDLPNGIGFCLYVTAACLDAVGAMPEVYAEGYYEDVEFCLRARERGLRTVAAPGVYVGHAGSRSFLGRKSALVARNLTLIEARFPGYRLESAAFMALDPLAPFRAALDRAAPPAGPAILVACGSRAAAKRGARRAGELARERPEMAVLTLQADPRGRLTLTRAGGGAPQSLTLNAAEAAAYLKGLDLKRIECLDPATLPDAALEALLAQGPEFVLLGGDLSSLAAPSTPLEGPCVGPAAHGACEVCLSLCAPQSESGDEARRAKWGRALERASHIAPLDRMAEAFARGAFKVRVAAFDAPAPPAPAPKRKGRVGVLYPQRAPAVDRLLRRLGRASGDVEYVVLGATLDDRALMATGCVFVTGPVEAEQVVEVARLYRLDALLGPDRAGGFGDLEAAAAALNCAKAYFDGSLGALAPLRGDLSLDPRICDEKAAARIGAWANEEAVEEAPASI